MMKNKRSLSILGLLLMTQFALSQDFIRLGVTHNFNNEKVFQTFTFDLNRTEDLEEKAGKYLIYGGVGKRYFINPTVDINIGEGIKSSENNILFQLNIVRKNFGNVSVTPHPVLQKSYTKVWNKAFEINPSYNADKSFNEKMIYAQLNHTWNFCASTSSTNPANIGTLNQQVLSFSLASNLVYHLTKNFDDERLYTTAGTVLDYKYTILKNAEPNINIKLSANYYYLISEVEALTTDNFAGSLKASLDKKLYNMIFLELSYKYGNNNPTYSYVNVLELSTKVKF